VDYLAKLPARLDCSGLAHTSVNRIDFPTGEMNMLTLLLYLALVAIVGLLYLIFGW